jgi:hypothetical protein
MRARILISAFFVEIFLLSELPPHLAAARGVSPAAVLAPALMTRTFIKLSLREVEAIWLFPPLWNRRSRKYPPLLAFLETVPGD